MALLVGGADGDKRETARRVGGGARKEDARTAAFRGCCEPPTEYVQRTLPLKLKILTSNMNTRKMAENIEKGFKTIEKRFKTVEKRDDPLRQ